MDKLRNLINMNPFNNDKINAIDQEDFDQTDMNLFIDSLNEKKLEEVDPSNKSPLDVIKRAVRKDISLIKPSFNKVFHLLARGAELTQNPYSFNALIEEILKSNKLTLDEKLNFHDKISDTCIKILKKDIYQPMIWGSKMSSNEASKVIKIYLEKISLIKKIELVVFYLDWIENGILSKVNDQFIKELQKNDYLNLNRFGTKTLLNLNRHSKYNMLRVDPNLSKRALRVLEDKIQKELPKREHIVNSQQSKLIRKMSIHSGKKLSLKEAQILNNSLNEKKINK